MRGTVSLWQMVTPKGFATAPFAPPLIAPTRLLSGLRFQADGLTRRGGRTVVQARAQPPEQSRTRGTLSYVFEFDAERGTVLFRSTAEDGRRFEVTQARNRPR
jgi:hypothetical protein